MAWEASSQAILRVNASILLIVNDDGQHPYRHLVQRLRAVRHVAAETQRIARLQRIAVAAVPIRQRSGEEVDELCAGVLEARKHFTLVGQRHEKGLEGFSRTALGGQ